MLVKFNPENLLKYFFSSILLVVSLITICIAEERHGDSTNVVIEAEVYNKLNQSEDVIVIILLVEPKELRKEPMNVIKQVVRQVQDEFLSNLTDDDFKLSHRNEVTPILIGKLTRKGLKKMEGMLNLVRNITVSRPVRAF